MAVMTQDCVMVGLLVPPGTLTEVNAWVSDARAIGVDSFWLDDPSSDAAVQLGALSQLHDGVRWGVFVSAFADRPPVLAWKQIVTIDHLSGGRLDLAVDDEPFVQSLRGVDSERLGPFPLQHPSPPMWRLVRIGEEGTGEEEVDVDLGPLCAVVL